MISPRIPHDEYVKLHLTADLRLRALPAETAAYLGFHREECFWASAGDDDQDDNDNDN